MKKLEFMDLKEKGLSKECLSVYSNSDFSVFENENNELVLKIYEALILKGQIQDIEYFFEGFID